MQEIRSNSHTLKLADGEVGKDFRKREAQGTRLGTVLWQ